MAWQFRRRIKIAPGVRLNISKGGVSTSFGVRGATITTGKRGTYLNTGFPGTGIYNRQRIIGGRNLKGNQLVTPDITLKGEKPHSSFGVISIIGTVVLFLIYSFGNLEHPFLVLGIAWIVIIGFDFLFSNTTSSNRKSNKNVEQIYEAELSSANNEIINTKDPIKKGILNSYISCLNLSKKANEKEVVIKALKKKIEKQNKLKYQEQLDKYEKEFKELEDELSSVQFNADEELTDIEEQSFRELSNSFEGVISSQKKWIISNSITNTESKSSSDTLLSRQVVDFFMGSFAFIKSEFDIPILTDNNDSYYLYPKFLIKASTPTKFELFPLKSLSIQGSMSRFIEDQDIPSDSKIIDYTYKYVNKDGSPDKRYSYNPRRSVVSYGEISFPSLYLKYQISNFRASASFISTFKNYLVIIGAGGNTLGSKGSNGCKEIKSTSDKVEDLITNSFKMNSSKFSEEYYNLLKEFSSSVYNLVSKLQNDRIILDYFKSQGTEDDLKGIIKYWVLYDLVKITSFLSYGVLTDKNLEGTGLVLLAGGLLGNSDNNWLQPDFETVKRAYDFGIYKNAILKLEGIISKENPLKTNHQLDLVKEQVDLALPLFLKINNDPLFDEYATTLYRFANIISKADNTVTDMEKEALKTIYEWTHKPVIERLENKNEKPSDNEAQPIKENETLEDVLNELNSLIGLREVKEQISSLMNFIKIQKAREETGLKLTSLSYHIVFTGNPGTGKTTVARILAKIYKHLGLLKTGQLIETDRSGLVAEFTGQTAVKVNRTVDSALDGVLFIDEAYSLVGENKDDFGKEAVATLIKRMEDDRERLILILAGYTAKMKDFIDTNPGFKSRFNRFINFPDYSPKELYEIFENNCLKLDYKLTNEAKEKVGSIFEDAYSNRDESFGNGRFARNIFERTIEQQANRIAKEAKLTKEILTTIQEDDIAEEDGRRSN